jgi:amino acid adenylation domain-containing protein/thioester reductase-like protein
VTTDAGSANGRLATLSREQEQLLKLWLEKRAGQSREIKPRLRKKEADGSVRIPTSWAQQRLWFIDQLEGENATYNVPLALRLRGPLDADALEMALDALVRRHDVFRTVFTSFAGEPLQEIRADGRFALSTVDLSRYSSTECETHVRRHRSEEATTPFDLRKGPLIRGRLLQTRPDEHVLLITLHHIISDGWSLAILLHEIAQLYSAYHEGRDSGLPSLSIQYADYAEWQRELLQGAVLETQLSYWRSQLQGAVPSLELPTDRPRPTVSQYRGRTISVALDATLISSLNALARRHGMTLFMVLYAGWAILLSRLSGQEDVVIGTPVANRRRPEVEGLIGFFVNTLPLRVGINRGALLPEFLERVKAVTLGAYDHQDMPFEQLVEMLRPERALNRHPIFQVMLVLQNAPQREFRFAELRASLEEKVIETSKFDLLLELEEQGDGITGVVNYDTDLLDEETVNRWLASYTTLLKGIASGTQCRLADLPMLSEQEQGKVIKQFNATHTPYPQGTLIHEMFEEQVKRTPSATAVVYGQQSLTYAEVNTKANQLARLLKSKDIGPNKIVGICVERSLEMIVGLLGILKAGAAYLPLDPNYPSERLEYMVQDAAPIVLLTQEKLATTLPTTNAEIIELDTQSKELGANDMGNLTHIELGPKVPELVYVIYTSGSTGRPKATVMPHSAMANLIDWHRKTLSLNESARVLQFAALSFDVAFQDTFSTLCSGGTLVLLDEWIRRDMRSLTELLIKESIERMFVPPLVLQGLAEHFKASGSAPQSLKDVIVAGEQLKISQEIVELFAHLGNCRLHNHYGPTETHVVTALTLDGRPERWPSLPTIGKPIANTQVYILDADRQPLPIGATGEIYIAGANVAREYLHRPDLTAERFVCDPFSADRKARMYKTGDLGRWRADGMIEYLGRNDDQVKIRGFRIELGEIEAQLSLHDAVKEAAVVAREDVPGQKRLVAYVTQRGPASSSAEELRVHLKALLPEYMVPSAFIALENLPLTPSGKLNRRALPAPDFTDCASQQYVSPQGKVEEVIASIWGELLEVGRVGRGDNFFEIGGHSLLVLKALFKINQAFGSALEVTDVYQNPTIRELAARVGGRTIEDDYVDLAQESVLDDEIRPGPVSGCTPERAILLTGGTGFVGRFLMAQLLRDTDATLYCLVRARSAEQASFRLRTTLAKWDLWRDEFEPRIVPIAGDLRVPRLGIDESTYARLCDCIDSIYHCGTSMNHLETYAMAKAANVDAVRELLKLATRGRLKRLHYLSTLGVFNSRGQQAGRVVDELSSIDQEKHLISRGYVASKWVGEKLVMTARERGIPCNIFRIGFVWVDSQRGRYDELQRGYRILKSSLLSGYGIESFRHHSPPTPVDYVARAVTFLARKHGNGSGVFHISSLNDMTEGLFERLNRIADQPLALLPHYDWICEMRQLHQEGRSLPIVPLIESAFAMDSESFGELQVRMESENAPFDCSRTRRELEAAGIVAPELDDELLRVCIESMCSRDPELSEMTVIQTTQAVAGMAGMERGPSTQLHAQP